MIGVGGRLRVALVFGGRSGEHEVSVISARSVASALDPQRCELVAMAIDKAGKWADAETAARVLAAEGTTPDTVPEFTGEIRLDPRLLAGEVDVVVPVLHGPFGEDGTIQGLCEILDVPYVGCSLTSCGITMDKVITKRLLREAGLPTPRFATVRETEWGRSRVLCEERCLALGLPLFAKPARLGSSVGISKVTHRDALAPAVERALGYDDLVIVEEGIDAREIELSVLAGDPPFVSVPGEVVPGHEFYDYADKYLDHDCQLLAPAPLAEAQVQDVQRLAREAFRACGCDGMARVDFLLERSSDRFLINELNAIPGFTSISMFPRLLGLSGVSYPRLLATLIDLAIERHRRRGRFAAAALRPLADRAAPSVGPSGGSEELG
jgi:D-alanine-D-alanine ligase